MLIDTEETRMISQQLLHEEHREIIVTSCGDSEGKSVFCRVLAETFVSRFQQQVIYVDLNRRSPLLSSKKPNLSEVPGIESRTVPSGFDEMSSSDKEKIIHRLLQKNEHEILIVECSPVNTFNRLNIHPATLASEGIPLLIIVNPEVTRRADLLKAKALIESHNVTFLGVVYNAHKSDAHFLDKLNREYWKHHHAHTLRELLISKLVHSPLWDKVQILQQKIVNLLFYHLGIQKKGGSRG